MSQPKAIKPKTYQSAFKAKVVLEALTGVNSFSPACREYEISEQSLANWKAQFLKQAATIFEKDKPNEGDPNEVRIVELDRLVDRLTVELDATKK